MFLGLDYIISSIIWLTLVGAFVFAFRKKIFKRYYQEESIDLFIDKLKHYLKKTYPGISFDYSIIETSQSEPNPDTRKYTIIGDIFTQFSNLTIPKSKLPKLTPKELQWDGYVFNCEPNKQKLPPDWGKRKNALLTRDNHQCLRCSKKLTISTTEIHMLKPLEDGGKYYLENLIPLCKDCQKLLQKDSTQQSSFKIKEDLEDIAETS
jgi:5-methylcytosine-specific restriction endonuclease McrA